MSTIGLAHECLEDADPSLMSRARLEENYASLTEGFVKVCDQLFQVEYECGNWQQSLYDAETSIRRIAKILNQGS